MTQLACGFCAREMPSFFMRWRSVAGFMPSLSAAPELPSITQCVALSTRRMCSRCTACSPVFSVSSKSTVPGSACACARSAVSTAAAAISAARSAGDAVREQVRGHLQDWVRRA